MTKPTKWLCAQRRLRSAWASAQSDQSLRCPHEEIKLGSLGTHWAHSEDADQTGRMPRLIWVFAGRSHFVGFVMRRLRYNLKYFCYIRGCVYTSDRGLKNIPFIVLPQWIVLRISKYVQSKRHLSCFSKQRRQNTWKVFWPCGTLHILSFFFLQL